MAGQAGDNTLNAAGEVAGRLTIACRKLAVVTYCSLVTVTGFINCHIFVYTKMKYSHFVPVLMSAQSCQPRGVTEGNLRNLIVIFFLVASPFLAAR